MWLLVRRAVYVNYYLSEQNSFSPTLTDVGSVSMCGPMFGGVKDAPYGSATEGKTKGGIFSTSFRSSQAPTGKDGATSPEFETPTGSAGNSGTSTLRTVPQNPSLILVVRM